MCKRRLCSQALLRLSPPRHQPAATITRASLVALLWGETLENEDQERSVDRTDPLHVAEDQDEQGPEENGDDPCSDEDHNLHVGLIAGAFTHTHTHTHTHNCNVKCRSIPSTVHYQLSLHTVEVLNGHWRGAAAQPENIPRHTLIQ